MRLVSFSPRNKQNKTPPSSSILWRYSWDQTHSPSGPTTTFSICCVRVRARVVVVGVGVGVWVSVLCLCETVSMCFRCCSCRGQNLASFLVIASQGSVKRFFCCRSPKNAKNTVGSCYEYNSILTNYSDEPASPSSSTSCRTCSSSVFSSSFRKSSPSSRSSYSSREASSSSSSTSLSQRGKMTSKALMQRRGTSIWVKTNTKVQCSHSKYRVKTKKWGKGIQKPRSKGVGHDMVIQGALEIPRRQILCIKKRI